jgi:hypothetical protein
MISAQESVVQSTAATYQKKDNGPSTPANRSEPSGAQDPTPWVVYQRRGCLVSPVATVLGFSLRCRSTKANISPEGEIDGNLPWPSSRTLRDGRSRTKKKVRPSGDQAVAARRESEPFEVVETEPRGELCHVGLRRYARLQEQGVRRSKREQAALRTIP